MANFIRCSLGSASFISFVVLVVTIGKCVCINWTVLPTYMFLTCDFDHCISTLAVCVNACLTRFHLCIKNCPWHCIGAFHMVNNTMYCWILRRSEWNSTGRSHRLPTRAWPRATRYTQLTLFATNASSSTHGVLIIDRSVRSPLRNLQRQPSRRPL